ncbi:conserved hypothetical protein [Ignisphaera aggregans DSM 17230]|uniref:PaREP5ab n=1 Tax=Ignisphaera aggregans (strain DSM 17230 / JCM 13409 / AQ1.S1) TaxID=583356 RepID=E0SS32_IGNAA|nr:conserved hypothetical protein [Ignisphaera aggregans DSM 17230]
MTSPQLSPELISSLASLVTVVISISSLGYWLGKKFGEINARFREIDMRFKEIDKRFQQIDERFREIDRRFEEVYRRFEIIDKRFEEIDRRFIEIDKRFMEIDKRFTELENRLSKRIDEAERRLSERIDRVELRLRRLGDAFTSYQEFLMRYFVSEGVLRREAAEVILTEARNIMRLAITNPFTKEEWKRLKELLDKSEKEDLTIEEAYELLNLARKVIDEYGEYPEAWKLHMYAAMMVGFAWKKQREREEKERKKE